MAAIHPASEMDDWRCGPILRLAVVELGGDDHTAHEGEAFPLRS